MIHYSTMLPQCNTFKKKRKYNEHVNLFGYSVYIFFFLVNIIMSYCLYARAAAAAYRARTSAHTLSPIGLPAQSFWQRAVEWHAPFLLTPPPLSVARLLIPLSSRSKQKQQPQTRTRVFGCARAHVYVRVCETEEGTSGMQRAPWSAQPEHGTFSDLPVPHFPAVFLFLFGTGSKRAQLSW